MKLQYRLLGAASLFLCARGASAAELYLSTFLGANPLKDLQVELDGRLLGETDARGAVIGELEEGAHVLRVLEKDATLAEYRFDLAKGESADVGISFTDFEQPPAITIDKYDLAKAEAGAPGIVRGQISDAAGAALAGARVRVEPAGAQTVSDADGQFSLSVPRGTYTLSVEHPGFEAAQTQGLRVVANVGVAVNVTLRPANAAPEAGVAEMDAMTVVGVYKPTNRPVDIKRNSIAVTDAISVEELLKAGDSDVAASLKRVVGVSIQGGRFAVVRGLAGRYIATTLNGDLLASTDPYRRDVELDLFPSDILSGIEIQKSFTADMPGDTTGGIIKIGTKGLPDEYVNNLSASIGGSTGTTGEKMASYHGGGRDLLGYDDGTRQLPSGIGYRPTLNRNEQARLWSQLDDELNPILRKAAPDFGLSWALGNSFDHDIGRVGGYGTVAYDRSVESRQDGMRNTIINPFRTEYDRDIFRTAVDAYLVGGIEAKTGWKLYSKTTLLRESEDTTAVESGRDLDDELDYSNILMEFRERQFLSQQLQGTIPLFTDHKLAWRAGVSQTSSDTPDRRSYSYNGTRFLANDFERLYAELEEDGVDLGLDYTIPLRFSDTVSTQFKFGALLNDRDRQNDLTRIGVRASSTAVLNDDPEALLTPEAFANGDFTLSFLRTTDTDTYQAEQNSTAAYVSAETDFGENFTLVTGLRQDNFKTSLRYPNANLPETRLKSNELLPSIGGIYRYGEQWQLRGGYSRTVSRPSITELAPSSYFDDRGRQFTGCSQRSVSGLTPCDPSDIDNYDLRVEYYINRSDSVSLAVFHKEIDKPLERGYQDGGASDAPIFTFRNSDSAKISGIELDGQMSWMVSSDNNLTFGANVSFIESEIKLDANGARIEGRTQRDLQGQSPFLVNGRIGYEHFPTSQTVTLTANYFDDRIDVTGRGVAGPVYEMGRVILNLTYEKEFSNRSVLGMKLRNLLDDDIRFEQNGQAIERWKVGVNGELTYTYKF